MKITKYKMSAVIPVAQYANIQPSIEIEGSNIDEAKEVALSHIQELFDKYSDSNLTEREIAEIKTLKSFNEKLEVEFDPKRHQYFYEGKQLLSASNYVSQFSPKFDAENISKNCEKSWGVPAKDIQEMWKSNGKLAADFGTAIHQALEHYFNHRENGLIISSKKGLETNYALPSHPFLKEVIEGFKKIDIIKGEKYQEVFVTDVKTGRCGQLDRLLVVDKKKKTCFVEDYKVNISAELEEDKNKLLKPYNELPKNKLSKYQLQMSFYADMLKNSGWKVLGLNVFVFEDEWKLYELPVIDLK